MAPVRRNTKASVTKLISAAGDFITVDQAAKHFGKTSRATANTLARWASNGWLLRVQRGLYVPVPLGSEPEEALEDSWALVPTLFGPGYLGGWTAAEHWDLTEQIFNDLCVFTTRHVDKQRRELRNTKFFISHIADSSLFGTKTVWRLGQKVQISDRPRTILDMMVDPRCGGGIQHVMDCFAQFIKFAPEELETLIAYGDRLGNGAVFKRLGYLLSLIDGGHSLLPEIKRRLTKGKAQLDPSLKGNRLITRWQLFVPQSLKGVTGDS